MRMDVDEVRGELEALGNEGFVQRYGRYFLVLTEPEAVDDFASFVNTASREAHDITSGKSLASVDVRPLVARKKGVDRITVGRDDESDIAIVNRKISKLHASFTVSGGLLSLSDAGSKNGTWLNSAPLASGEQRPVDVGDTVNFGSVSATIWGIDDLIAAVGTG
jgi:hypothetical protein